MTLESVDLSQKKKNKLGYHRQSVACSHCRRRKIRCLPSPYFEGKCENCMRTGKNCHFLKVSEDDPLTSQKKGKTSRANRASSLDDAISDRETKFPTSIRLQPMSDSDNFYAPTLNTTASRRSSILEDHYSHMQPHQQYRQPWPLTQSNDIETYESPVRRPVLRYRMTEPVHVPRPRDIEPIYDYKAYGPAGAYRGDLMQPSDTRAHIGVSSWPTYGILPCGNDMHSSRTSERSSSFEALAQAENAAGLTPWPPSPAPTTVQPPSAFYSYVPMIGQDHVTQDRASGPPSTYGYPYAPTWNNP